MLRTDLAVYCDLRAAERSATPLARTEREIVGSARLLRSQGVGRNGLRRRTGFALPSVAHVAI